MQRTQGAPGAGYSGKPLTNKLGIKASSRICVEGAPDYYLDLLQPVPEGVVFEDAVTDRTDLVHFFSVSREELDQKLRQYRSRIKPTAMIWVSWPKKASKAATNITEDVIREVALPLGFVDVKVCAVDQTWSGLKLVIRKELRQPAGTCQKPKGG